jgi:hypothetical protein
MWYFSPMAVVLLVSAGAEYCARAVAGMTSVRTANAADRPPRRTRARPDVVHEVCREECCMMTASI